MSILGALGGLLARGVMLRGEATLLGPPEARLRQDINRQFTNDLPGPEGIFAAYNSGIILPDFAQTLLANNNIEWGPAEPGKQPGYYQAAWEAVRQAFLPVPGVEAAIRGWAHGLVSDRSVQGLPSPLNRLLKRAGTTVDLWRWTKSLALSVPDVGTINQAFTRGYIDFDEWKKLITRSGARDFHWNAVLPAYEAVPSIAESILLYNRRHIDDPTLDAFIHRNGFADQNTRELIKQLRFTIPSISDLITMQVREVFDPKLANELGLYNESPSSIIPYFEAQGLNWGVTQADRVTPLLGNVDGQQRQLAWPDLYWGMHWRPFSPEQVFRMWHLLRPERIQRYKGRGLNVEPTDLDFVRRWLRIQDYPPNVRDYLSAIAFQPLRLIDIRNALATGVAADAFARENNLPPPANQLDREVLSRRWAIQQFLDRGVHPDDAEVQADLALATEARKRTAPIANLARGSLSVLIKQVLSFYQTGVASRVLAERTLRENGVAEPTITLSLDNVDRAASEAVTKQTIKLIRQRYMDGATDANGVREELNRAGIVPERGTQYINLWTAQRTQRSRMATTADIQDWAQKGFLTPAEAAQRLRNLGWSEPDTLLHLAEIQANVNQIQARTAQAAVKSSRAQAKEIERLIQETSRQQKELRAELRRLTPVSTVKKWLKTGIISQAFFQTRLAAMGYPASEILLHMQEALSDGANQQNGQAAEGQAPEA